MGRRILIVEDEYSINDVLSIALKKEGYDIRSVYDGKSALSLIDSFGPDLILLDLMLPDMDGFDICKEIGSKYFVIMLTARDDFIDKIVGLELGADDYITKPFAIKEIITRIKALFRSLEKKDLVSESELVKLKDDIELDFIGERIFKNGMEISLKKQESALFFFFLKNRNRVFTRAELLDKVWGYDFYGDTRTIDVHIRRIRSKLDVPGDALIETVFGTGYVMR